MSCGWQRGNFGVDSPRCPGLHNLLGRCCLTTEWDVADLSHWEAELLALAHGTLGQAPNPSGLAHTPTCTHSHLSPFTCTYTHTQTHVHTYVYIHSHACTHTQTLAHTYTPMHIHIHTHIHTPMHMYDFADSSVGKESACSAGSPSSIPGSGRSDGEEIGYPL